MYAYLEIARRERERVIFPDGESVVVAAGEGSAHARSWTENKRTDEASKRAIETTGLQGLTRPGGTDPEVAAWAQKHAQWQRRLDAVLDPTRSVEHARMLREEFLAADPEPLPPHVGARVVGWKASESQPERGQAAASEPEEPAPVVTPEMWWYATITNRRESAPLARSQSYPYAEVAAHMTQLETEGWHVVDMRLEQAVVHHAEASYTTVERAWILIHRDKDRGGTPGRGN